jgi:hypothetical protein
MLKTVSLSPGALNRVFFGGDKDAPFGCSQAFQDRPEQSV